MKRHAWWGGLWLVAGTALAQDEGLSVSAGVRAWYTQWTTFSYFVDQGSMNLALTQVSGPAKWVAMPTASLRYGAWLGSFSATPSTRFDFAGESVKREEFDLNVGYAVLEGLNVTLGYKKIAERGPVFRYEPAGPVAGMSANAPLAGAVSVYGAVGAGRLKTPMGGGAEVVKFKASYRLTEVGLAYSIPAGGFLKRWTLTAGHRVQVMHSKDALEVNGQSQEGVDTRQGFTLGALATF
ncbi:MAG: hypothetical protein KIT17_25700 [Rubrivivax sp.]|nr:hypothetical protein [Rubrivivax sp.]